MVSFTYDTQQGALERFVTDLFSNPAFTSASTSFPQPAVPNPSSQIQHFAVPTSSNFYASSAHANLDDPPLRSQTSLPSSTVTFGWPHSTSSPSPTTGTISHDRPEDIDGPPRKVSKPNRRGTTGCLTCRLRKKKCDESKPTCQSCVRLGIECLGYGRAKSEWFVGKGPNKRWKDELRDKILVRPMQSRSSEQRDTDKHQESSDQASPASRAGSSDVSGTDIEHQSQPHTLDITTNPPAPLPVSIDQYNISPTSATRGSNDVLHPPSAPSIYLPNREPASTTVNVTTVPPQNPSTFQFPQTWQSNTLPSPSPSTEIIKSPFSKHGQESANEDDTEFDEMWRMMFDFSPSALALPTTTIPDPAPYPTLPQMVNSFDTDTNPDQGISYLHHYLQNIVQLQFDSRRAKPVGEILMPLALQRPEVLGAVTSLAALHLAQKRQSAGFASRSLSAVGSDCPDVADENSALVALSAHQDSLRRLQSLVKNVDDYTSEAIVFPAAFAITYCLFEGGTSPRWRKALAICQKCLRAVLQASPDLIGDISDLDEGDVDGVACDAGGDGPGESTMQRPSTPWKRYRPVIESLIATDVFGSISTGKAPKLLPVYRNILGITTCGYINGESLSMLRASGCSNITLLALAEITGLYDWAITARKNGSSSARILAKKAEAIEQMLTYTPWRTPRSPDFGAPGQHSVSQILDGQGPARSESDQDTWKRTQAVAEVFHASASLYLETVVSGSYPYAPEIVQAVAHSVQTLRHIDDNFPSSATYRKLVFPITIAGCHCTTPEHKSFFRRILGSVGPESTFGTTNTALVLMEAVWKKRAEAGDDQGCWRQTMKDLGWEAGFLML